MQEKTPQILIVDENPHFGRALYCLFQYYDFDVDHCTHPKMALEWAKKRKYDILITDYKLKGMDGVKLAQRIRMLGLNSDIKSYLITKSLLTQGMIHNLNNLDITYMKKPVNTRRLMERIKDYIYDNQEESFETYTPSIVSSNSVPSNILPFPKINRPSYN